VTKGISDTLYALILKPLLAILGLATLAQEAFYTVNTFRLAVKGPRIFNENRNIGPTLQYRLMLSIAYPRPSLNHYVRKLEFELCIGRQEWGWLARLAGGAYGFQNRN
jgi:hypothetical protein